MRVVGLLNWFDESEAWLAAAVTGFARVCDIIVALDGAYALYPGGRPCSSPRQAEAIMHTAEAAGSGCLIYRPNHIWWDNELQKRNQLIQLAGSLGLTDEDWLLVFDADNHILHIDPEICRATLDASDLDIGSYTVLDGKDFLADEKLAEYVKERPCDTEWTMKDRNLFRWNPTLRVGPQHWTYSVEGEDGERVWVRGPEWNSFTPACDLGRYLVSYHRPEDRPKLRRERQEGYYKMREEYRVEFMEDYAPPKDAAAA